MIRGENPQRSGGALRIPRPAHQPSSGAAWAREGLNAVGSERPDHFELRTQRASQLDGAAQGLRGLGAAHADPPRPLMLGLAIALLGITATAHGEPCSARAGQLPATGRVEASSP
jgi:hypothetical protein